MDAIKEESHEENLLQMPWCSLSRRTATLKHVAGAIFSVAQLKFRLKSVRICDKL